MWRHGLASLLAMAFVAGSLCMRSEAAGKPNIVLITVESARADSMGFLGGPKKNTPTLDTLAAQSLVFEQSYAQAPTTVVSHATILSGTYPQTHRAGELGARLLDNLPFTPELLRASGYRTAAFVGTMALDPRQGLALGFERGFSVYDAGAAPGTGAHGSASRAGRGGAEVIGRASAWLARNSPAPFFLWVQLNDADVAAGAAYNAGLSAADAAVGKLTGALRIRRHFDDSLIVIAADHGQSLGAHGEAGHGIFLYDETIRVPLLVKMPGNEFAGKRVRARARLVDVAPTILEVAGVAIPSQMQGQSLLRIAKTGSDQPAYSITSFPQQAFGWSTLESWRAGKYLYIRAPKPELYDLSTDPAATRNLALSSKATLETIAGQLDAFDRRLSAVGQTTRGPELTSSEMQKLASLGYVGLQKSTAGSRTAASGFDPKDGIDTANRILSAEGALNAGKPDMAIAILQPLLPGSSGSYLAQYVMGAALARKGQYSQAIERLRTAIEIWPDSAWAHYEMGSSLIKTGDYKTAVIHLEIAAGRLPDFSPVHLQLADAYEHLGKPDDAKRERTKARD